MVVDSNIIFAAHCQTAYSSDAQRLLERLGEEWLTHVNWRSEFIAGMRDHLFPPKGFAAMSEQAGLEALLLADKLVGVNVQEPLVTSIVPLLVRYRNVKSYDLEFVALAVELGLPLVTADLRLVRALRQSPSGPEVLTLPEAMIQLGLSPSWTPAPLA